MTISLCPFNFSGIALEFEVFEAFGTAELEYFAVIADEGVPMPREDVAGAEVALLDPHLLQPFLSRRQLQTFPSVNPALRLYHCDCTGSVSVQALCSCACCIADPVPRRGASCSSIVWIKA